MNSDTGVRSGRLIVPPNLGNPFTEFLELEDGGLRLGWARVLFKPRPELLNMHGRVHGGVIMTLLDTTMARAAMARHDFRLSVVSIAVTANFLRPGSGPLTTEARANGGGRSICFCEAEVLDEGGRIVANGVGTFRYREPVREGTTGPESIE